MIPENYVRLVGRKLKEIDGSEIQITEDKVGDGSFSKVCSRSLQHLNFFHFRFIGAISTRRKSL